MLTGHDLDEIAGSQTSKSEEWMVDNNVTVEAMLTLFNVAWVKWCEKVMDDGDHEGALIDVVGQAFRLGWEAHRATA